MRESISYIRQLFLFTSTVVLLIQCSSGRNYREKYIPDPEYSQPFPLLENVVFELPKDVEFTKTKSEKKNDYFLVFSSNDSHEKFIVEYLPNYQYLDVSTFKREVNENFEKDRKKYGDRFVSLEILFEDNNVLFYKRTSFWMAVASKVTSYVKIMKNPNGYGHYRLIYIGIGDASEELLTVRKKIIGDAKVIDKASINQK